jgi:alkanesulfonate monooxygenase SsuD/methylene tetrahydromethanopterin reductase-like flavin-dependent oxidoreductase (luciferase family)
VSGETPGEAERIDAIVRIAQKAEEVGMDVFAIGEHHNPRSSLAAPEDWGDTALNNRIDRAVVELVLLMESGFARKIRDASWDSYQHEYGSGGEPRSVSTSTPTRCGSPLADLRHNHGVSRHQ